MRRLPFALMPFLAAPAAAEPFFLPGTQPGELEEEGVPLESVAVCMECHADFDVEPTEDYEPWDSWSVSPMAQAMRDPVFLAALTIAEQDSPDAGEYCLRCHAPEGWLAGRALPGDGSGLTSADRDGVTCDVCHRMVDGPWGANGQYLIDPSPAKHGRHANTLDVHHANVVDEFAGSSELCGTCHHVGNPARRHVLPDGTESDEQFPLQTTYLEWAQSAFQGTGKRCIDCHMEAVLDKPTSGFPDSPVRATVLRHDLVGGSSAWLAGAVPETAPIFGFGPAFDAGAERSRSFLRGAATVEFVSVPEFVWGGDEMEVVVRVTNLTGHKLPTGFADGRRMWLEVSFDGVVVSGAYDEEESRLLTEPPPMVWQAVNGAGDETPSSHIVLQDRVLFDNRIPPEGFAPTERTAPVGTEQEGHQADVTFRIPVPDTYYGYKNLRVRLLRQVLTREYVEFLRDENVTDERGEVLFDVWRRTGRSPPEEIGVATARVETGLWAGGCFCRAGGGADSGGAFAVSLLLAALSLASTRRAYGPSHPTQPKQPGTGTERRR